MSSVFAMVDTDSDGSVSEEDIERARQRAHDMHSIVDIDGDGQINGDNLHLLWDVFEALDIDGDGTVSRRDVQNAENYGRDLINYLSNDASTRTVSA